MKRYPVELSILALTLLLGLIGCLWLHHYTAAGLVSEEEPLLFGATYMTMNNPFYEVIDEELRNQVEAGGDVMITSQRPIYASASFTIFTVFPSSTVLSGLSRFLTASR